MLDQVPHGTLGRRRRSRSCDDGNYSSGARWGTAGHCSDFARSVRFRRHGLARARARAEVRQLVDGLAAELHRDEAGARQGGAGRLGRSQIDLDRRPRFDG